MVREGGESHIRDQEGAAYVVRKRGEKEDLEAKRRVQGGSDQVCVNAVNILDMFLLPNVYGLKKDDVLIYINIRAE